MALPTLYDMCQSQTIVNMRAGLWSQCQENPFTRVPPKLVDKLRESIFSMNFRQLPNREALLLLFTSHRVKKLDLSCFLVNTGGDFQYCLQHLRRLKRLNSLSLDYAYCEDFDLEECFSSLGEIRHQLKHLVIKRNDSMAAYHRFPLNVVIDNCENLETLGILKLSAINLPLKMNTSFRRLKRICISMTSDCLGQVLRYCDDLTYLLIVGEFRVDESELQENLSHTSALKLQTLAIKSRYFTRNAMRMVLEKAPNLEKVCFSLDTESGQSLLRELGRSIVFYDEFLNERILNNDAISCLCFLPEDTSILHLIGGSSSSSVRCPCVSTQSQIVVWTPPLSIERKVLTVGKNS
ncbi:hypothetical protein CEXT_585461 [Caerostris extrusa]|uniref:Uncharacterized protein n=1 Tax=Caerostris extrusa TaxID=172846 RepID=A0AAV4PJ78_CAEEX|nr:hypothetical protein CEXT_585461 [Caerostris extrusa]